MAIQIAQDHDGGEQGKNDEADSEEYTGKHDNEEEVDKRKSYVWESLCEDESGYC
jgi:hypothetical protein